MRFKRHTEIEHGLKPIDITPLIDIVFQLLIFFMLSSSFISNQGIKVNLPKAVTAEAANEENLLITVSRENVIYLDKKVLTVKELKTVLVQAGKEKKAVLILADQRTDLGRVVEVWDIAREAGVEQVNIAAETQ